jgi:hypothetical protein
MQPWYLRPGTWLFFALLGASIYSAIKAKTNSGRDQRIEECVSRVDRVLCIWARNWGAPTEEVKAMLLKAIDKA